MCEPTTALLAASLVISAASAVTTTVAQNNAADAQEEYQSKLTAANTASAGEQMAQLRQQEAQSRESTARENERARLASQKSRATAVVAAGDAGVSGNSVDALLQEYEMQLGQFREATARQQKITGDAIGAQVHAVQMGANNQGLSINAPIERPSWGVAGLRFASDALTATHAYKRDLFTESKTGKATKPPRG